MRYFYMLAILTAMIFVAVGLGMGNSPQNKPPSKSCPPHYTWNASKGCCVPPTCPKGYTWNNSQEKCVKK
jgi:hypothetical protein